MKKVHEFVAELNQLGLKLWYNNGSLGYEAPTGVLTPMLRTELVARKDEVLAWLRQANQTMEAPVVKGDATSRFPLSYGQQALWFVYQQEPLSSAYNVVLPLEIHGKLEVSQLQQAAQMLVERQPALRTIIVMVDGVPMQEIQPVGEIAWTEHFASHWTEEKLLTEVYLASQRPHDLTRLPSLRIDLFHSVSSRYLLVLTQHHIFTDARSFDILFKEWLTLYTSLGAGISPPLPPLSVSYADYVAQEAALLASPGGSKLATYWQTQLAGEIPLLNLPIDHPRPPVRSYHGTAHSFYLSPTLSQQLRDLAQQEKTTLFTIGLAVFQLLLHRYTGQPDLWIGTPTAAGRLSTEFANLVGYLINPVVIRATFDPSANLTGRQFLTQTKQTIWAALDHQSYPFPVLVQDLKPQRDTAHTPLFQAMFSFESSQLLSFSWHRDELSIAELVIPQQEGQFDLTFTLKEGPTFRAVLSYHRDLFEPATITRLAGHLETLLQSLVANLDQSIYQLPLLPKAETQQILAWNQTQADYPQDQTLVELFQTQAEQTPDQTAIIFADQQLTYRQLNTKANQLAHYLITLGVGVETLVGISVERSLEMVIGLLGILKAGGAYVPLDPSYPPERLQFMLADSQVPVLLSQRHLLAPLPPTTANVVDLTSQWELIATHSVANPINRTKATNLAYVIYTSGSTGRPKGVLGTHQGMVNRLTWMWQTYPFEAREMCCHRTSINFVDHVAELFSPLLKGVSVVLLSQVQLQDTIGLINLLQQHRITRLVLVPSLLRTILEQDDSQLQKLTSMKYWFCSGEALPGRLVQLFYERLSTGGLVNIYGSSEVSADVIAHQVERQDLFSILNYFLPEPNANALITLEGSLSPDRITTPDMELDELKQAFHSQGIPHLPQKPEEYYAYLKKYVLPYLVNTSSPRFIGHMTSALPSFNYELIDLVSRLNQNMVKVETSKSLVFLERQAMAMLHRAFYECSDAFYQEYTQQSGNGLGITVSGGTTANISALWVARNLALPPDDTFPGVAQAGLNVALAHYGYNNIVLLGSRLMHYSMRKAASLLGLGEKNIIYVAQADNGKMDLVALRQCIEECYQQRWCILALVGIAGATETGNIDPLAEMAEIANTFKIYFHVDGAWGGPVIFSPQHRHKLKGIERADSITICGHKQLYLPMGISFCLFQRPDMVQAISTPAAYQARVGGYDFGQYSPEGSRSSLAVCLHAAFHLIGKQGYAKLIDAGINKAQYLTEQIKQHEAFELMGEPELNIVNFRYLPAQFRTKHRQGQLTPVDNLQINEANVRLQEKQFQTGRAFFSKTQLVNTRYGKGLPIEVERAVLANPLTTYEDIDFVLADQLMIADQLIEQGPPQERNQFRSPKAKANESRTSKANTNTVALLEKYTVPIGKPISNTQIYLLDAYRQFVPIGVSGELYVGGVGLARGYLNQPALTQEKFVNNPFSEAPDSRLYQTGDLARYLPDGNLEYLGRIDNQVKLRGFRIELGEIEATLAQHPAVAETAVVVYEASPSDKRLVAYLVPQPGPVIVQHELRDFLTQRLPSQMIPAIFMILAAMPLTPNGKIDRRALPKPEGERPDLKSVYVIPQTEIEQKIADVWKPILQVEKVGIDDNFFEVGGNSLLMMQVQNRLQHHLEQPLSIVELLQYPTIRLLATHLTPHTTAQTPRLPAIDTLANPALEQEVKGRSKDIAIIGLAGRFPGAKDINRFWQNLRDGVESVQFFTDDVLLKAGVSAKLLANPNYVKASAILEDVDLFDATFFNYNPNEAKLIDPQQRLLLECAWEAMEHAGYDADHLPGAVGVFAGVGTNNYWLNNLADYQKNCETVSDYQLLLISNDKDFLPTRISYKLNLKGPSVNVQTACSTSLVAVHLAGQSLLNGECQMALAGGVSIPVPRPQGYLYQEGMIMSPDGHCRAFDAQAQGTVWGNGLGLVVLKTLDQARRDGDYIYAIIKGSAINNDGAIKVGYTAPSVDGQAAVIAKAMQGIDYGSISYIETHGTGTTLGDPIEIAALTQAYRTHTQRIGYCALGSVKTNVGHLDAAAGITSLIKTVLALQHQQLPPSLHLIQPNPKLDLANSPFFVNTRLTEWPTTAGQPRRAGVSSFGIGGTNAHLVLEEAPRPPRPPLPPVTTSSPPKVKPDRSSRPVRFEFGGPRPWQLLLLSAKTETALEVATIRLAQHLQQHPALNLANVAYTLSVGRKRFPHRRLLVSQTLDEATEILSTRAPTRLLTQRSGITHRPVVWMFSGQGSQYANMTLGLYQQEPLFREYVNRGAEILKTPLNLDIRELLYPSPEKIEDATRRLEQTALAQPALFVVEYAMAQLWKAWGVQPTAMIGHSIGEYVAACIAGVFTLEDALNLVATRGRLMQSLPIGAMLSVALSEEALQPFLTAELSLAAHNAPNLGVVAGPTTTIETLAQQLAAQAIECRRLHTSHAFHTAMMTPMLASFREQINQVKLNPPQQPYLSNVTGTWITTAQATDPDYWAQHLRQPVRFSEGVQTLLQSATEYLFLEVGPGRSLATFVQQQPIKMPALTSIRHPQTHQADLFFLLTTLGQLWLAGVTIDWTGFYAQAPRQRLPLPTYPFERQSYWVEPTPQGAPAHREITEKTDINHWFYLPSWKRSMLQPPPTTPKDHSEARSGTPWLVFMDETGLATQIVQQLKPQNHQVTTITTGPTWTQLTDHDYSLNPKQPDDYNQLIKTLVITNQIPQKIIHLWTITGVQNTFWEDLQHLGFYSLLFLMQALGHQNIDTEIQLIVVSNNLQEVTGEEPLSPAKATLLGPIKVIGSEYPNLQCRSIDVIWPALDPAKGQLGLTQLMTELMSDTQDQIIAYRGAHRWLPTFEPIQLETPPAGAPPLRTQGVYLITGGLGGIGLVLATHLAKTVQAKLILTRRSAFPRRAEWAQWLASHAPEHEISDKIRQLQALEAQGAEVLVISADVTHQQSMQEVITIAKAQFGVIHGVIHTAGIAGGGVIQRKTADLAARVLDPKVRGTMVLYTVIKNETLDFFILCSSISSILATFGQVDYCAANAFLDAYAHYLRAQGMPAISINWDTWQEVGMAVNTAIPLPLQAERTKLLQAEGILPREGIDIFNRVVGLQYPQLLVSTVNLPQRLDQWRPNRLTPTEPRAEVVGPPTGHARPSTLANAYVAPRTQAEQAMVAIWQILLDIEQIGIYDNFFELGGHSLLATRLILRIQETFSVKLPMPMMFELPTVAVLAVRIEQIQQLQSFAGDSPIVETEEIEL